MASRKDIAQLEKQLGGAALQWVLPGLPVVALFDQSAHLGEPFARNQESDCLLLWVGLNDKTGQILFTLTHRFASSRRGRLLFLVMPSEFLVFRADAPTFWTVSEDKIPSTIIDEPNDDCSYGSLLLRMQFQLDGLAKCRVIMPSAPVTSKIPAPAMALLRKFKALSEAPHFELFTNYDASAADSMRRIQTLMQQPHVTTPSINLVRLYPGARDADYDVWKEQGWCEHEAKERATGLHHTRPRNNNSDAQTPVLIPRDAPPSYPASTCSYTARLLSSLSPLSTTARASSPPRARQAPPSYVSSRKRAASASPPPPLYSSAPRTPRHDHAPCRNSPSPLCRRDQHGPWQDEGDEEERDREERDKEEEEDEEERGEEEEEEDDDDDDDEDDCANQALTRMPQSSSPLHYEHLDNDPDYPLVAQAQEAIQTRYTSHDDEMQTYPADTGHSHNQDYGIHSQGNRLVAESPRVEVEVKCSFENAATDGPFPATPSTSRTPLFNHAQISRPVQVQPALPPPIPVAVHAPVAIEVPVVVAGAAATKLHCPLPTANRGHGRPPPQHHLQMPAWLIHAWSLCPCAHYLFVTELLKLGAVSFNPDPSDFNTCRAIANTALLSHWAQDLHAKSGCGLVWSRQCSIKKHHVEADMSALFHWLSVLDGQADLHLSGNFKALASARETFLTCDSKHEDEYYASYMTAKAWFVTKACRLVGASVLARDKNIARKIIKEMNRVGEENQAHQCSARHDKRSR